MSSPPRRRQVALVVLLTSLCATSVAFARITRNTIDPVGLVTERGVHVVLTGPVECTEGERLHMRVTVSQRSSGAVAEGRLLDTCAGAPQEWTVHASGQGGRFEPGPAIAVALAHTTDRGKTNDAHQWLVPVTLVEE